MAIEIFKRPALSTYFSARPWVKSMKDEIFLASGYARHSDGNT
jgi:hypothetical protein